MYSLVVGDNRGIGTTSVSTPRTLKANHCKQHVILIILLLLLLIIIMIIKITIIAIIIIVIMMMMILLLLLLIINAVRLCADI